MIAPEMDEASSARLCRIPSKDRSMEAPRNNFNLMRLAFATAVVYSHSFALLGLREPVLWGRTLGTVSVHGFFVISGYLISDSYLRYPNLFAFSFNRFLRIVPGLLVALVASHWLASMCGGYATNPVPYIGDGPVWTLTWEMICYAGIAIFGLMLVLTKGAMPVVFACGWLIYLVNTGNGSDFYGAIAPMFMMFLAGAFIRLAGNQINLGKAAIPSAIILLFSFGLATSTPILDVIHSNIVFLWGPHFTDEDARRIAYLASFPLVTIFVGRDLPALVTIRDDISYGVYVYGWPVTQVLVFLTLKHAIDISPTELFFVVMVITTPIAWLSWRVIERPAVRLKIRPRKIALDKIVMPAH